MIRLVDLLLNEERVGVADAARRRYLMERSVPFLSVMASRATRTVIWTPFRSVSGASARSVLALLSDRTERDVRHSELIDEFVGALNARAFAALDERVEWARHSARRIIGPVSSRDDPEREMFVIGLYTLCCGLGPCQIADMIATLSNEM